MSYLDYLVLIVLAIFFIMGLRRGFFLTLIQVLGIFLVVIVIRLFGVLLKQNLHRCCGLSDTWATIIGYILVFLIVMILAKLVSYICNRFLKVIGLAWVDRLLGGILGLIFGTIFFIMFILFADVSTLSTKFGEAQGKSKIYTPMRTLAHKVFEQSLPYIPGSKEYNEAKEKKNVQKPF